MTDPVEEAKRLLEDRSVTAAIDRVEAGELPSDVAFDFGVDYHFMRVVLAVPALCDEIERLRAIEKAAKKVAQADGLSVEGSDFWMDMSVLEDALAAPKEPNDG